MLLCAGIRALVSSATARLKLCALSAQTPARDARRAGQQAASPPEHAKRAEAAHNARVRRDVRARAGAPGANNTNYADRRCAIAQNKICG